MVVVTDKMRETGQANALRLTDEDRQENVKRSDRMQALQESDPQAFEALMKKIAAKILVPHSDGQREVLMAKERFLVLCAGRRWGKSQVGAARALRQVRKEGQTVWWAAPTYKNVKHGYNAVIKQLPDGMLTHPAPPDSSFDAGRSVLLRFKNGSKIQFFSAERPEGMLGGSCDYLILDEAALMPEHVWTTYLRSTLADRQGGALFISTPRTRNWFYYIWARGQSQDPEDSDWRSWRFPSFTNPTIPASEWEEAKRDMPAVEYEQEILAEFISEAASVFRFPHVKKEDGEIDHSQPSPAIKPLVRPRGHVLLGIDLAKHSDWTVLFATNGNAMPCYHDRFQQVSWPVQKQRIFDAVDNIMQYAEGVTILVDSGGPGDVVYDDLEEAGYDVIGVNFTTHKERMVKLLSSDIEQGKAFILEEQLPEFQHYSYSITPSGRWKYAALRGHDDEVSAVLLAHWGLVHEGVPNIQTLTTETSFDQYGDGDGWDEEYVTAVDDGQVQTTTVTIQPPSLTALLMNNEAVWH